VLSGVRRPTSGRILVDGKELTGATPAEFTAAGVGRIPEDRHAGVVGELSVAENLALEYLEEFTRGGMLDREAIRRHAEELIQRFQIKARPTDRARTLSGGNLQKLILARVLSRDPKVVLASQPTRGLDVGATEYVRQQLLAQRARGAAVLLILEDLDEIPALSDRIAVPGTTTSGRRDNCTPEPSLRPGWGRCWGGLPPALAIPIMLLGGFIAGALWALTPALLRVKLAVDEVVTTLLLNSVMLFIVSALLNGPWRSPVSGWPQSPEIAPSTVLPKLIPRSRLHLGFVVAILSVVVLWFVLSRTSFGLKMRAAGLGREAVRFAGVNVGRTMLTAALISGGIAGIVGVSEVAGIHFHLIEEISPGYGYTGIIIATLGTLNAWGVAAAALFFGLIDTGTQTLSHAMGVPIYLGEVTQATMLLVTLAMFLLQSYRIRRA